MTDHERVMLITPTTTQSVNITATDTTSDDLDVDIKVALGLELVHTLVEVGPCFWRVHLESYRFVLCKRHIGNLTDRTQLNTSRMRG